MQSRTVRPGQEERRVRTERKKKGVERERGLRKGAEEGGGSADLACQQF